MGSGQNPGIAQTGKFAVDGGAYEATVAGDVDAGVFVHGFILMLFSKGDLCVFIEGFAIFRCYVMVFCGDVVAESVAKVVC
jgi:hypothetical protein